MPMEPLSMRKIREVMRLRYEQQCHHRDIARGVKCSPSTVSTYLQRAKAAGLSWPLPDDLDDKQLYARLFPPLEVAPTRPLPNCQQIHQELKRKGVTLLLLWYEYREQHPDGVGYSRFCELYAEFAGTLHPTLRLTHVAGDKLFVDYAGLTLPWVDSATGEIKQANIFVAVLGASNYTYVEATATQSLPDWIHSHVHAFNFFGGQVTCRFIPGYRNAPGFDVSLWITTRQQWFRAIRLSLPHLLKLKLTLYLNAYDHHS